MSLSHRVEQLVRMAQTALEPGGLRAMRRWKPFSLTQFRMMRRLRSEHVEFGTILDGGANVGQFARAAAEAFPQARIIAFEALPDVARTLRSNLADCSRVRVIETAIGSEDGVLTFHRNAYSPSSSALPLHRTHREAFPEAEELEAIEVPVARLDTLLRDEDLPGPVLMKLDLQGFEHQALLGAEELMARVDYILLETAFSPLYEGEALFHDLDAYLGACGFRFLRPVDVLEGPDGAILQMDALFVRADRADDR